MTPAGYLSLVIGYRMQHFASMQHAKKRGAGRTTAKMRKVPITLRIDEARFQKLMLLAEAENRTPTNFVETALLRDMDAREEVSRVITMLVPAEAAGANPGALLRSEGESDDRYAERSLLFDRLFAIPDSED